MKGIKKQFIKGYLNLRTVEDKSGLLIIHSSKLNDVESDNAIYGEKIIKLLQGIKGIISLNVDYNKGLVTIKYDVTILNTPLIFKYIDLIIEVVAENLDTINKTPPEKVDEVLLVLNEKLNAKIAKL
ncbi:MAG: hypothetical protein ATN33_06590 [Epulopiscium sp. Nele67-Bin001]|nr:MAG: hypothetical protein BEN18_06110 [Epulopiscium sp. Nuni2H_MBin001]OON92782.1 MAG: hypothetical protein ATN33_06590 [Epulopiscium sp. Nele67-Bin001]